MGRAPCCEKVGLKRGRWTEEEDEILLKYIQANGEGSWRSLPKNAGLLRCGKSCRLRWINYLRSDLKRGNFSAQEEDTIVKLHSSFGNRWSLIASHLPGRTDNEIKNYWNSHLSRKIYSFKKVVTTSTTEPAKAMNIPPPPSRRGGRTSRWAMKKNKSNYIQTHRPNKPTVFTQPNNEASVPLPPPPPPPPSSPSLEKAAGVVDMEVKETTDDDDIFLGLLEVEEDISGGGGALLLSDMMESCLMEEEEEEEEGGEACGVQTLIAEERGGNNDDVEGNETIRWDCNEDKMASSSSMSSSSDQEYHKESGNSVNLDGGGDDSWNWESVMEFNEVDDAWEQKEKLLTWLWNDDDDWESDGNNNLGEKMDLHKQNDVIAWFLSET